MFYSVYIIKDREKTNDQIFDDLAGDLGLGSLVADAGLNFVNDIAGLDIDRYASKEALGEDAIVISGKAISSINIKSYRSVREVWQTWFGGDSAIQDGQHNIHTMGAPIPNNHDDVLRQFFHNWQSISNYGYITIKGTLTPQNLLEAKFDYGKRKNLAQLVAWSTLHAKTPRYTTLINPLTLTGDWTTRNKFDNSNNKRGGDIDNQLTGQDPKSTLLSGHIYRTKILSDLFSKYRGNDLDIDTDEAMRDDANAIYYPWYHRRALITVYSEDERQFRAIMHNDVWCFSYAESYNKKNYEGSFTLILKAKKQKVYDTFVYGPTYKFTIGGLMEQISKSSAKLGKTAKKGLEFIDKVAGTEYSKGEKFNSVVDKFDKVSTISGNLKNSDALTLDKLDSTTEAIGDWANEANGNVNHKSAKERMDQYKDYTERYKSLTKDQQEQLKALVPDFDKLSVEDKLYYINSLYKEKTPAQKEKEAQENRGKNLDDAAAKAPKNLDKAAKKLEYEARYDALTPEDKVALENIPEFKGMTYKEKLEFLDDHFNGQE